MVYDIAIIGGGASGLAAAVTAKRRGLSIIVLEAENRAGKKILATGNGKCNLSNTDISKEFYNTPFVETILNKINTAKIVEFFVSLGLKTKEVEGRIYPYTESANTVLNALRYPVEEDIKTDYLVKDIRKDDYFIINGEIFAKNILLATGSKATTGIESKGLLEKFGHMAKEGKPSLVPLVTDTKYIKGLSGIRVKARADLYRNGIFLKSEEGEVLFKDNGLSGIAIFILSSEIARKEGSFTVRLDFAPDMTAEELKKYPLEGIVRKQIADNICKQASDNQKSAEETLKNFEIKIISLGDIKNAQVVSGGLLTEYFNENTLESKLIKGLYASGEVLDVDGTCGGYNLHWAFASGIIVGQSLK